MTLLNKSCDRAPSPPNTNVKLKPHQEAMLMKMYQIERKHNVGVMNDAPGCGKSFPILALILWEKLQKGTTQNILVVPQNLFSQWQMYITRYSNDLKCKALIDYQDISQLMFDNSVFFKNDIIITTSMYYSIVCKMLGGQSVSRIIIDEIDSVSWFIDTQCPAHKTWFVSASFQNDKVGQAVYKLTDDQYVKCEDQFVEESFDIPLPIEYTYECYDEYARMIMSLEIFDDNIIDQIKGLDYNIKLENVHRVANTSKELLSFIVQDKLIMISNIETFFGNIGFPCKEPDCHVLSFFSASKYEKPNECYLHKSLESVESFDKYFSNPQLTREDIEKKIRELTKCKGIVKNILQRINQTTCPICLDDFDEIKVVKTVVECCKNVFCLNCLKSHLNSSDKGSCPLCRKQVNVDALVIQTVIDVDATSNKSVPIGKLDCIQDILEMITKTYHKVIIFSDFDHSFKTIQEILRQQNVSYAELDGGNIEDIDKAVEGYKYGEVNVLMASSLFYGSGLNFENTTDVILLHKSSNEKQNVGRAQRPGRSNQLRIHKLLYSNEMCT
jgi:SNF2 family DNA or RNA helicase